MAVVIVVVAVVVLLVAALGAVVVARRRRTRRLREQFGPEYDRVLAQAGSRGKAESMLAARRERRDQLELRSLDPSVRDRFLDEWRAVQRSFVDDPPNAVEQADALVTSIMRERGYPLEGVEQRAADLSVDHPDVVENYREARRIRDAHGAGTDTEGMRAAVASYRDLVEALLDESVATGSRGVGGESSGRGLGVSGQKHDDAAPDGRRDGSRG